MLKKITYISMVMTFCMICFWSYYFYDFIKGNELKETTYYPYNEIFYSDVQHQEISNLIIPSNIYPYIRDDGWKIIFSSVEIEPYFGETYDMFQDGLGVTVFKEKTIFIEIKEDFDETKRTFYHELSHVMDYYLYNIEGQMYSDTTSFKNLYEKYKETYKYPYNIFGILPNKYVNGDVNEFFAGLGEAYYLYPWYLKENYPELFNYFTTLNM